MLSLLRFSDLIRHRSFLLIQAAKLFFFLATLAALRETCFIFSKVKGGKKRRVLHILSFFRFAKLSGVKLSGVKPPLFTIENKSDYYTLLRDITEQEASEPWVLFDNFSNPIKN
jgi:hypothetical protein